MCQVLPVTGTSPVGGNLTYRVSPTLPAGLGLNATNGVISGTPGAESSATTYTIVAQSTQNYAITIQDDLVENTLITRTLRLTVN
ncbi:putative Ig domain-containing protein [Salmonella enterica]|nr:putative Ig domain-containing protein [Salmonella enterica]